MITYSFAVLLASIAQLVGMYTGLEFPQLFTVVIREDSVLWDCQTMGNLLCGFTVK